MSGVGLVLVLVVGWGDHEAGFRSRDASRRRVIDFSLTGAGV